MTPERAKELLPIIQAYSEGKEIQVFDTINKRWLPANSPTWLDRLIYRIKPTKKEGWIQLYKNIHGFLVAAPTIYKTEEEAKTHFQDPIAEPVAICKIEWEEQ